MEHMTILIVEDDQTLALELQEFLEKWGYAAMIAHHFDDIRKDFQFYQPQLLLLDVNLPKYDGFYWCSKLRELSEVPILFISSRNHDADKIMGMIQGGDDYIEKPFHLHLLKAKIEAVLRRTYQYKMTNRIMIRDDLYFDKGLSVLLFHDKKLDLTKSEKRIMIRLLESRPTIITRDELMMELWDTNAFVSDGTLSVMISRLRYKVKTFYNEDIIATKKGQGYYIP